MPRRMTAIWKPTEYCNLACKYCYVSDKPSKDMMSLETMRRSLDELTGYVGKDGSLKILIHGGEPMMWGMKNYEQMFAHVDKLRSEEYKIYLSMQTNGTLFTDASLDYMIKKGVRISVSLDGTEDTNAKTRVYLNGTNSYQNIVRTIKMLKEKTDHVGLVVTVSRANIDCLIETYEHLKEMGVDGMLFNHLYSTGRAMLHLQELTITPEEWNGAMISFFRYWNADTTKVSVDPFEEIINNVLTNQPKVCHTLKTCQNSFIGVDHKGDISPCGRGAGGHEELKYGNIHNNSLEELLRHPLRHTLLTRSDNLREDCQNCNFKSICNGGCPLEAHDFSGNILDTNPLECNKLLLEEIYATIETKIHERLIQIRRGNKNGSIGRQMGNK